MLSGYRTLDLGEICDLPLKAELRCRPRGRQIRSQLRFLSDYSRFRRFGQSAHLGKCPSQQAFLQRGCQDEPRPHVIQRACPLDRLAADDLHVVGEFPTVDDAAKRSYRAYLEPRVRLEQAPRWAAIDDSGLKVARKQRKAPRSREGCFRLNHWARPPSKISSLGASAEAPFRWCSRS